MTPFDRYDRIRVLNRVISRADIESHEQSTQHHLQSAYLKKTPPECQCQGSSKPIAMYIARLGDVYVVKRRPQTGHLHHAECESHGGISVSAQQLYSDAAIKERQDGKVVHNLAVPLSTIEQTTGVSLDEAAAPPRPLTQQPKRSSMTLRGFLNLLWEEAGLHTWSPGMAGKRNLSRVYWGLRSQLADRIIGVEDASARVYIPQAKVGPEHDKITSTEIHQRFDHMDQSYGNAKKGILILIAELRQFQHTARNTALRVKGLPHNLPIWTPPQSIARMRDQFAHGMDHFEVSRTPVDVAWEKSEEPRIFIIAGIQRTQENNLIWRYGAAMETTATFIPIDSGLEFKIANLLVAQERRFEKPLRYDGVAATFPDFVLTDCQPPVPLEVYGMNHPEYDRRKAEKNQHYQASGQPYWAWDAMKQPTPPDFPLPGTQR